MLILACWHAKNVSVYRTVFQTQNLFLTFLPPHLLAFLFSLVAHFLLTLTLSFTLSHCHCHCHSLSPFLYCLFPCAPTIHTHTHTETHTSSCSKLAPFFLLHLPFSSPLGPPIPRMLGPFYLSYSSLYFCHQSKNLEVSFGSFMGKIVRDISFPFNLVLTPVNFTALPGTGNSPAISKAHTGFWLYPF